MGGRHSKPEKTISCSRLEEKQEGMYRSVILDKSAEHALELVHLQKTLRNNSEIIYRLEQRLEELELRNTALEERLIEIEGREKSHEKKRTSARNSAKKDNKLEVPLILRESPLSSPAKSKIPQIKKITKESNSKATQWRTRYQQARDDNKSKKRV